MISNLIEKTAINRPWKTLTFILAVTIVLGMGVTKFTFSNDYRDFFSDENPQLMEWEKLQNIFTKTDNVLFSVTPKSGDVFNPQLLSIISELTEAGWKIPHTTRVDSITNFQHIESQQDNLLVSDLLPDPNNITFEDIEKIRKESLSHSSLVNLLINPEGTTTAINVTTLLSEKPRAEIQEIGDYVYQLAESFESRYPQINIHITGAVPYNYSITEATKKDLGSVMPIMYLVVLVIIGLFLRTFVGVIATFITTVFAITVTMGSAGWSGIVLMAPSLSAPTIIMTMMVANSVHIFVTFYKYYLPHENKNNAIIKTIKSNLSPIIITNVTTAVGFLTMNFSDVPPYRDLGNMVAGGLIFVVLFTLILIPTLLRLLPCKSFSATNKNNSGYSRFANFVIERPLTIIAVFSLAAIILIGGTSRLELNDLFVEWLDDRYEFRNDSDFINTHLTGVYRLDWSLDSGEVDGINDPDYLLSVDKLTQWARNQNNVVHVQSLSDTIKELNMKIHNGNSDFYRIPEDRMLASQLLLLYEMSLPKGLDLNNMINVSKSATHFIIRTRNMSTKKLLALENETKEWLSVNARPSMLNEAASTTILFANIADRNIQALLGGTLLALVLISVLLIVPLKSIKFGLVSLIPNLLPVAIGFGIWGLLVSHIGLAISIVVGMTLGIVVDDTVHFLTKYLRFRREQGYSPEESIRQTFIQVGPALLCTSVVLVTGFSILATSGFEINSQMGALTSIIIFVACAADFLLLPAILLVLERKKVLSVSPIIFSSAKSSSKLLLKGQGN